MADIPELVLTTTPPSASDSDATFDSKAFPWAASLNPFGQSISAIALAAKANAEEALAATAAGELDAAQRLAFAGYVIGISTDSGNPLEPVEITEIDSASQAEAEAGVVTDKWMAPLQVKQAIDAQRPAPVALFEDETITGGGLLSATHSFGRRPLVQCYLKCVTAEFGYAVDDIVLVDPGENAAANASYGQSVTITTSAVSVRFGSLGKYQIINKSSGVIQTITTANWTFGMDIF